jgi:hypothetical protein
MWFDAGMLERFPERPSVRPFLPAARQAASRCRKLGHLVPRAMAACASCRSAPVGCPACGSRLSLVVTSACAIDICVQCEGVWLDAGEFEQLEGVKAPSLKKPAAPVAAAKAGWEVPEATAGGADPWKGPGADRPLAPTSADGVSLASSVAMHCHTCGRRPSMSDTWAKEGNVYCGDCRPRGATSGSNLPKDSSSETLFDKFSAADDAVDAAGLVSWLFKLIK